MNSANLLAGGKGMLKSRIFLWGFFAVAGSVYCCTTFFTNSNGAQVFGRTLDWWSDHGVLITNKKNVQKNTILVNSNNPPLTWVSKYSSLTFNQVAQDFPYGGVNERGLIVEILILGATQHPEAPVDAPAVNESQWIQYMLDSAQDLNEVEALARNTWVQKAFAPVHYFVCDAGAHCGVFEFVGGELKIYRGTELSVASLTNSTYPDSLSALERSEQGGGGPGSELSGSLGRFVKAATFVKNYTGSDAVNEAFNTISQVADLTTRWRVVYDNREGAVHFKTTMSPAQKTLRYRDAFPSSCREPVLAFDLQKWGTGDIRSRMAPFTRDQNDNLVNRSKFLTAELKQLLRDYRNTCVE